MANPVLSGLSQYVNENAELIHSKITLGIPNIKDFTFEPGNKGGKAAMNIVNAEPEFGDGATCGVGDGEATISQRKIDVADYKSDLPFCERQLLPYVLGLKLKVGEDTGDFAYEETFTKIILSAISKKMEKEIWAGVKSSGARIDGLMTIAATDASKVTSTGATVYAKTLDLYKAAAEAEVEDFKIYMSRANFLDLVQELVAKNLVHYSPEDGSTIILPGTTCEVIGVKGLKGNAHMLAVDPANIHYAFDDFDDMEAAKWVKDEINDKFYFKAKWAAGVNFAIPTEAFYL